MAIVAGAALLVVFVLLALGAFWLAGRSSVESSEPATTETSYAVTVGLDRLQAGCAQLTEGRDGAEICLDGSGGPMVIGVDAFQPRSDLTVLGGSGDTVTLTVDADGTVRAELSGRITESPIIITGTLADGGPATVTFALTGQD